MESWGRPQWRIRLALWGRGQSHLLRVVVQAGGERWKFGTVSGYGADIWLIINKSLKGQFWWPDWGWRPAIAWGEDEFSAVFASKCFWTRVMGACNCEGIQMPYEKVVQMITQKWATRGGDDGLWEDKRTKCMSASMMVKSMDGGGEEPEKAQRTIGSGQRMGIQLQGAKYSLLNPTFHGNVAPAISHFLSHGRRTELVFNTNA